MPITSTSTSKQEVTLTLWHLVGVELLLDAFETRFHQPCIPNLVFEGVTFAIRLIPDGVRVLQ
jgi:hypothetical protein